MLRLFNDTIILRLTLNQTILPQLITEIEGILPDGKKLPRPELNRDGNLFRYKFDIKTKNHELFNKNLGVYKVSNPQLDIFAERVNVSMLNKTLDALNLKNLIFPTGVTIRYTMDANTDPRQLKETLDSYLPDEELPNPTDIGGGIFRRFKINFKVKNTESFQRNLSSFKSDYAGIDIYEEYDKRTLKSYINIIVYGAFIFFTITRALGYDIIQMILELIKRH